MRNAYPQLQVDTANGDIMKGPETIARLGCDAEMWMKRYAWDDAAGVEWTAFSDALKAIHVTGRATGGMPLPPPHRRPRDGRHLLTVGVRLQPMRDPVVRK